jgi:hypothetical protein
MVKNLILIVCFFLTTGLLSGCAPIEMLPVLGASYQGYVVWKHGESTRYYAHDLDRTYQAVRQSCEQLKLEAEVQNMGSGKGYSLETKGRHHMEINVLPRETNFTSVVIKVGLFGDKEYAEFFYRTVDENISKKGEDDHSAPF